MKKILLMLTTLVTSICVFAQKPTIITGTADVAVYQKIALYKVVNGRPVEMASVTPDTKQRFIFQFIPEYEGLYLIGKPNNISFMDVFKFYFKGGEKLNLHLKKGNYELTSKTNRENELLTGWYKKMKKLEDKYIYRIGSSTFADYFPEVETLAAEVPDIKKFKKTGNRNFDKFFPTIIDFDVAFLTQGYIYAPHPAHPTESDFTSYYRNFNSDNFLTDDLLRFPYGDRILLPFIYSRISPIKRPGISEMLAIIPSDLVKGQLVLHYMENAKSYIEYAQLDKDYQQFLILDDQKSRAQAVALKLVDSKPGAAALSFTFTDVKGNLISLVDFKGKMILLDFWATWCGPCRSEEPYWEKLNEEYTESNIVFVGISIDKDKEAWKKYLFENDLKGIQLYAGNDNNLSKAYKITNIPRYILIDKDGKIISINSPRPSNESLKKLLNTWLLK